VHASLQLSACRVSPSSIKIYVVAVAAFVRDWLLLLRRTVLFLLLGRTWEGFSFSPMRLSLLALVASSCYQSAAGASAEFGVYDFQSDPGPGEMNVDQPGA
jgi:hypothetical protein